MSVALLLDYHIRIWHGQPKTKVNTVCRTVRERQYDVKRETDLSVLIKTVLCYTVLTVGIKRFRE